MSFSVRADGGPVIGGEALEMVDVAQGVGGLLGGEVRGVRDSTAGPCARVDLDELAAVKHPDQLAVGAHVNALADQVARDGVDGPGDLDVMVAVHPGRDVHRDVVRAVRGGQQLGLLLEREQLGRPALGGAVCA